jgi:ATP-dependent RNA/DNA helicase IGHMBP2
MNPISVGIMVALTSATFPNARPMSLPSGSDDSVLLSLQPMASHTPKGKILELLETVGRIQSRDVGRIELRGRGALVSLSRELAARAIELLDGAVFDDRVLAADLRAPGGSAQQKKRSTSDPVADHFENLLELLEIETQAAARRTIDDMRQIDPKTAERYGQTLVGLVLAEENVGLGGRILLSFRKVEEGKRLPWTRLSVGTPVLVTDEAARDARPQRGIVCKRDERLIQVALDDWTPSDRERPLFRLDRSDDETAARRQAAALERTRLAPKGRLAELRDTLLGLRPATFADEDPTSEFVPFDEALNATQVDAVRFALRAEDVAIVHGPPGTGKTTTLVEYIRHCLARGEKVLVTAASNMAVDNLLERLLAHGVEAVRLGHPARVLPQLRDHSLDLMVENHPDLKRIRKLEREALTLKEKAGKTFRAAPPGGFRAELRAESREILADARRWEARIVDAILDHATVVCATTTGLDSELLGRRRFSVAVIDEAAQCTEPSAWIPLLRVDRVVLAGDHCQLPATVISPVAQKRGLGISLMERLVASGGKTWSRLLEVQYRMHTDIMEFSSSQFYEGRLRADASVASATLADLGLDPDPLCERSLRLVDTAGAGYEEEQEPDGSSRLNPAEAEIALKYVGRLLELGLDPADIAVISPYAAQVRHLRDNAPHPDVEIDTVDGFQGREKEAVIVSLVRSNVLGDVGFLAETRRMNVALTRARRLLVVIGDSATISNHPFFHALMEHFETRGAYHTVWEDLV